MVAIYTYKVLEIDETIKVWIHGKGYWLRIKEKHSFFENKVAHIGSSKEQEIGSQSMHEPVQSEDDVQEESITPSVSPNKQNNNLMVILNTEDDEVDNFRVEATNSRHGVNWESREATHGFICRNTNYKSAEFSRGDNG